MSELKIDPNEITVMPNGSILYKGEDIRNQLVETSTVDVAGFNVACINASSCNTINIQCDNLEISEGAVNIGLCRNGQ